MTTKIKIISGFVVMSLLLAGVAVLGYRATENSAAQFDEYERLAKFSINLSDLESAMFQASTELYSFVSTKEQEHMKLSLEAVEVALEKLRQAQSLAIDPSRLDKLALLLKSIEAFRGKLGEIQTGVLDADAMYQKTVQPAARGLMEELRKTAGYAEQYDSVSALVSINDVWNDLAAARSSISRFAESLDGNDAKRTDENFVNMEKALTMLRRDMQSTEAVQLYAVLSDSFGKLRSSFKTMTALGIEVQNDLSGLQSAMQAQSATTHALNLEVSGHMESMGKQVHTDNARAQKMMMGVSGGGIVLGIAVAVFIVIGLISVLRALSSFAGAIARGNFKHELKVREGGEIGATVAAMREIPVVLQNVMEEATTLSENILTGNLRSRLDSKHFQGAFSDLAISFNVVSDAYTGVIDSMPLPIMNCDEKMRILFLNKVAQSVLGSDYSNETCDKHLSSDSCNNAACFGKRAMSEKHAVTGETSIRPQGKQMEVGVTAIPHFNSKGGVAGYMEILTDLTEIKRRQATILQVTARASEIADRVAAASEEIAAQVEQISRGADVQRSRVESTASAMTEMNSTVLEVAQNAGKASEQSEGTREKAEGGASLVNKVVSSINAVNTVTKAMQQNMQGLGEQAESIGGVMNVISDIADQTNLLALNAAIEAARAGEAGRGFAVVADEVRKLAEKTMSATQEVGSNISAIQQSTRKNIEEMENSAKGVAEATELARSSGDALAEIVHLAAANSSVVASIATAAEEQSATSEEISRAIEEINHIVAETTDGITQSSQAVQELASMAQELRKVMESLR
ncbi:methyl-accepting chemotaxis protein [Desulfovibrio sp. OttesenSCG-928-A18]|nr:methyl-accepting chemotaxis protein [Desulfovibrio sp. OttesenSCG-928-A18]